MFILIHLKTFYLELVSKLLKYCKNKNSTKTTPYPIPRFPSHTLYPDFSVITSPHLFCHALECAVSHCCSFGCRVCACGVFVYTDTLMIVI